MERDDDRGDDGRDDDTDHDEEEADEEGPHCPRPLTHRPRPLTDSEYNIMTKPKVPKKQRSTLDNSAYRKMRRHKLTCREMTCPVTGEQGKVFIVHQDKIVPRESEVADIISHYHHLSKGEGTRKLAYRINTRYTGKFSCESVTHATWKPALGSDHLIIGGGGQNFF